MIKLHFACRYCLGIQFPKERLLYVWIQNTHKYYNLNAKMMFKQLFILDIFVFQNRESFLKLSGIVQSIGLQSNLYCNQPLHCGVWKLYLSPVRSLIAFLTMQIWNKPLVPQWLVQSKYHWKTFTVLIIVMDRGNILCSKLVNHC